MRRFEGIAVFTALSCFLICESAYGQRGGNLRGPDFSIEGIAAETDSSVVRRILGSPSDSTTTRHLFLLTDITNWTYPGLTVELADGAVQGFVLLSPKFRTHRGLRVGDPQGRVLQLYGEPYQRGRDGDSWRYFADNDDDHFIEVLYNRGRVMRITLDWQYAVDYED